MAVFEATTEHGLPLFGIARFFADYRDFKDTGAFPWLLEIVIHFEESGDDGLPTLSELETISDFQDDLLAALAGLTTVHYVGHITGNFQREFYCYLPEPSTARAFLAMLSDKPSKRDFRYTIGRDPDWVRAKKLGT